jgi:hypothetical protein
VTSWADFASAQPEFAERVYQLFASAKHMTVATLRKDGAPRISGTEVAFEGGELLLGMMAGSMKSLDLVRDPRLSVHSPTVDPPEGDPAKWAGDAKVSGRAVTQGPQRFAIDIAEVVLTKVGSPADHLVIESWHPDEGFVRRKGG